MAIERKFKVWFQISGCEDRSCWVATWEDLVFSRLHSYHIYTSISASMLFFLSVGKPDHRHPATCRKKKKTGNRRSKTKSGCIQNVLNSFLKRPVQRHSEWGTLFSFFQSWWWKKREWDISLISHLCCELHMSTDQVVGEAQLLLRRTRGRWGQLLLWKNIIKIFQEN